ncbi:hypothetical protein L915_21807, partial [Phytophthora nicotianae]
QRTLEASIAMGSDKVQVLSTRWLLSSGLPYTILQNDKLLSFVRRLGNQPRLTFPALETFYAFADSDFGSFIDLLIIGVTIIFIDKKW